jgi:methionyl-tRNA formyltransferase
MQKNKENLRLAFMGTPEFSVVILESLLENGYPVVAAFSRTDKVIGRKKILEKTPVKICCEKNNIPVFTPEKIDAEALKVLIDFKIDLIILVAYGKILPKTFLDMPALGAINVHASLLPKYRGPSPVQNALLAGEKITGSTIMQMDAGIDTGDILRQKEFPIRDGEDYPALKKRMSHFSADLLIETLEYLLQGKVTPQKQDASLASYCQLIRREDGLIDWREDGRAIFNRSKAFSGWPGIYTFWENGGGKRRIKLNRISFVEGDFAERQIGEVFVENKLPCIKAGTGAIAIHEMQLEGKSNMSGANFLNGYKNFIGSIIKS